MTTQEENASGTADPFKIYPSQNDGLWAKSSVLGICSWFVGMQSL